MAGGPIIDLDREGVAVVTDGGAELSFRELGRMADGLAERIPPGSVVFILNRNDLPSLVGLLACLNHGSVPLMLDAGMDAGRMRALTDVYRPDFLWRPAQDGFALERLQSCAEAAPPHPDLAMLLATSGSTGSPKLVRLSRRNVLTNAASHVRYLGLREDDRFMASLPMDHTYGISMALAHLHMGARVVLTRHTIVERPFWEEFSRNGISVFGGVPYTYEMLDRLMFFRRNLPSLRLMTSAGGRLRDDIHLRFADHALREGKEFIVMYGQSEATAAMAYLPADRARDKVGSVGVPIPGGRLSLSDAGDGELLYEGPNVSMGYAFVREDFAKGDERGGRLATGDIARVDADGFFFIDGRKSRFLKLQGHRVGLDETELMVKTAFAGTDCACTGTDELMKVHVSNLPSGLPDAALPESVRSFLSDRLRLSASLFEVIPHEALPKAPSGKTLYSELG